MHNIQNEFLSVGILDKGAELCSIFDKRDQTEHLWQADPAFWGWHAPMLFPVIGACEDNVLRIGTDSFPMQKHGFARHSLFTIEKSNETTCTFLLKNNPETYAIYPYVFELRVHYSLLDTSLLCSYEVINTGDSDMHFCIGGHPAFALAYRENETISDYYIEFEMEEDMHRHHIDKSNGLFTGEKSPIQLVNKRICIDENIFKNDALIFKPIQNRCVHIGSNKHSKILTVRYPDFNYLGIWSMPGAKYVCIEPWLGCADTKGKHAQLNEKEGVISLSSKQHFKASFIIEIS